VFQLHNRKERKDRSKKKDPKNRSSRKSTEESSNSDGGESFSLNMIIEMTPNQLNDNLFEYGKIADTTLTSIKYLRITKKIVDSPLLGNHDSLFCVSSVPSHLVRPPVLKNLDKNDS
jgi:hypothetical protein